MPSIGKPTEHYKFVHKNEVIRYLGAFPPMGSAVRSLRQHPSENLLLAAGLGRFAHVYSVCPDTGKRSLDRRVYLKQKLNCGLASAWVNPEDKPDSSEEDQEGEEVSGSEDDETAMMDSDEEEDEDVLSSGDEEVEGGEGMASGAEESSGDEELMDADGSMQEDGSSDERLDEADELSTEDEDGGAADEPPAKRKRKAERPGAGADFVAGKSDAELRKQLSKAKVIAGGKQRSGAKSSVAERAGKRNAHVSVPAVAKKVLTKEDVVESVSSDEDAKSNRRVTGKRKRKVPK